MMQLLRNYLHSFNSKTDIMKINKKTFSKPFTKTFEIYTFAPLNNTKKILSS